jgi:SapC
MKPANYVPLSNEQHKQLKVKPRKGWPHVAQQHLIPITVAEFPQLSNVMPLMFIKGPNEGSFIPVAITGFTQDQNLFCESREWANGFLPMKVSSYPLAAKLNQEGEIDALHIDENSMYLVDSQGEALFDDSGEEASFVKNRRKFLRDIVHFEAITYHFVEALKELNLITEIKLGLEYADGNKQGLLGLYTIDGKRLESRSDEEFLPLRKRNYLHAIYTMMTSAGQFEALRHRHNDVNESQINRVEISLA